MSEIKTCHVQSEICDDAVPRFRCKRCTRPVCRRCSSRRVWKKARSVICNACQVDLDGDDRRVRARIRRVQDGFDGRALDLEGRRLGELQVLERVGTSTAGDVLWRARCSCGNEIEVRATLLQRGRKSSCGCRARRVRHGKRGQRIYQIWQWLKQSGQLDEAWRDFHRFYRAVGDPPGPDMTIQPLFDGGKVGPQGFHWVVSRRRVRRRKAAERRRARGGG